MEAKLDKEVYTRLLKRKNTKIKEVELKIGGIDIGANNVGTDIKYILAILEKLSISMSFFLYQQQSAHFVLHNDDIREFLNTIDDLLNFQISHMKYQQLHITLAEQSENFDYVGTISLKILKNIIIKEYYLIRMIATFFRIDMKWLATIGAIIVKLAQVSFNYTDIRGLRDPNIQNDRDIRLETANKTIDIQCWVVEECIKIWSSGHGKFFAGKALAILNNAKDMSSILGMKELRYSLDEKIQALEKRVAQEEKS